MEIIAIGRLAWIMSMTIIVLTLSVSVDDDDHDPLHFSLRPPQIFSSLASDSIEDSIFPTTFKKVDKILHEMKGKVGLGGPNPKHKVELSEDSSSHTRTKENGASSRIDVPDYGEEKNKVSNSSYNVNETYGFRLINGTNNNIPTASYVVAELRQIGGGDHDVGLFGIFDGVMNYQTPAYLQSYLFKNITAEPEFWLSTAYAVRRGYLITNNDLVERDLRSISASSAVTAILMNHHDEWMLVVTNVCNSRAIIIYML